VYFTLACLMKTNRDREDNNKKKKTMKNL